MIHSLVNPSNTSWLREDQVARCGLGEEISVIFLKNLEKELSKARLPYTSRSISIL